jgi:hypothetical protein
MQGNVNNRLVGIAVDGSGADTAPVDAAVETVVTTAEVVAPVEVPVASAPQIPETIENAPVASETEKVEIEKVEEVAAVAPVEAIATKVTETIQEAPVPSEIKEQAIETVKETTESHLVKSVSNATVTETPIEKSTKKKGGLGRKVYRSHVAYQNLAEDCQLIPLIHIFVQSNSRSLYLACIFMEKSR